MNILVFGGSQGAQILSQVVPRAMASLSGKLKSRLTLTQQCRPEDLDQAQNIYDAANIKVGHISATFSTNGMPIPSEAPWLIFDLEIDLFLFNDFLLI